MNLLAQLAEVAARQPEAPAIEFEGEWISYGTLQSRIENTASFLDIQC